MTTTMNMPRLGRILASTRKKIILSLSGPERSCKMPPMGRLTTRGSLEVSEGAGVHGIERVVITDRENGK